MSNLPVKANRGKTVSVEIVDAETSALLMTCATVYQASARTGVTPHIVNARLTVKLTRKGPAVYSPILGKQVLFRRPGKVEQKTRRLRPLTPEEAERLKQQRNGR